MVAVCGVAATTTVRHSHQPPPLCALPRPVRCVCVCWWWDWAQRRTVVARTLVWRCAWRLATTPTSHAVHACRLSPLSCPQTHPPTHTQMALLTPHTHGVLCVPRPIHSLTHWLPHCPHTLHTHWWVCVCSSTCSHAPSHTAQAQAWRLPGCFGVVVTNHHAPCATHTHRDWWWAPWWWLVVGVWALCGCHATPPTRLACHHTRHIHHHTHHGVLFVWHALPLPPPPLNPITHTPQQPLCHNGGCHWSPRRPHTPHTCHTRHTHTKGKHRRGCGFWCGTTTTLVLAIRCLLFFPSCPPTPFSLSLLHALTHPSSPHQHHHPIHPLCVVCVVWEWTDGWTTLWLSTPHTALLMGVLIGDTIQPFHPPSPLSLCFCPPPTTTPSLFSVHHTPHTEEKGRVGMDLLVLWVCDG